MFALLEGDELDPLRGTPGAAHGVNLQPYGLPARGHNHELIGICHRGSRDHAPRLVGAVHGLDADTAATLHTVFLKARALAQAVFGDHQQVSPLRDHGERYHVVALAQADAAHPDGVTPLRAHVVFAEANAHAVVRHQHHILLTCGQQGVDQAVALLQIDGDDTGLAVVGKVGQRGLLHRAVARGKDHIAAALAEGDVLALLVHAAFQPQHGGDVLLGLQVEQVLDGAPLRAAGGLVDLVHALHIHAPRVGEEHEVVVVLRGEKVLHIVAGILLGLGGRCLDALAATRLQAILVGLGALDVAAVGDGHHHRIVGNEILDGHVALKGDNLRQSRRGVLGLDGLQLVLDDAQHARLVGQNVQIVLNLLQQRLVFIGNLVVLQRGELVEAQVEDGVDLALGEHIGIALHARLAVDENPQALGQLRGEAEGLQAAAGVVAVLGVTDDADELIEVGQCDEVGLQNLRAILGFAQQEARAAHHDLAAVLHVEVDGIAHGEHLGTVLVDGQHVDGEARLQAGELVELVDDDLRAGIALELDFHIVGQVSHAGDVGNDLVAHQLGDALLHHGSVDTEGHVGDVDELAPVFVGDDLHLTAHEHTAAPRAEVAVDALGAEDEAAGGEVRSLDVGAQLLGREVGVVDEGADAVHDLAEVVRRHVGGHAYGNARAAVDQQVGEGAGEDHGLGGGVVVVGLEVHRVLVQVIHEHHAHG